MCEYPFNPNLLPSFQNRAWNDVNIALEYNGTFFMIKKIFFFLHFLTIKFNILELNNIGGSVPASTMQLYLQL